MRDVAYRGEPVAVVVATSYEAARDAGEQVVVTAEPAPSHTSFDDRLGEARTPPDGATEAHSEKGDIDAAFAAGVKRVIPAEFGVNTRTLTHPGMRKILQAKIDTLDHLIAKSQEKPDFTWTAISNSFFLDLVRLPRHPPPFPPLNPRTRPIFTC